MFLDWRNNTEVVFSGVSMASSVTLGNDDSNWSNEDQGLLERLEIPLAWPNDGRRLVKFMCIKYLL